MLAGSLSLLPLPLLLFGGLCCDGGRGLVRFADVVLRLCYMDVLPVVRKRVFTDTQCALRAVWRKKKNLISRESLTAMTFDYLVQFFCCCYDAEGNL